MSDEIEFIMTVSANGSRSEPKFDDNLAKHVNVGGFNQSFACTECFVEFNCEVQLLSHQFAFHTEGAHQFGYRCSICCELFSQLETFIQHQTCTDRHKHRLGLSDNCVCLLCGCAQLRPHLNAHLVGEHDWAINLLQVGELSSRGQLQNITCNLCSPHLLCKNKAELLTHLSCWHSTSISIESVDNKTEQCKICKQSFSVAEFRQHVVTAHCPTKTEVPSKSPTPTIPPERKKKKRNRHAQLPEEPPKKKKVAVPEVPKMKKKKVKHKTSQKAKKSFVKKRSESVDRQSDKASDTASDRSSVASLSDHEPEQETPVISPTCTHCSTNFDKPEHLALHLVMGVCRPTSTLSCPLCDEKLMNWQAWQHIIEKHNSNKELGANQKSLSLMVCGMKGYQPSYSNLDGDMTFPCHFCSQKFTMHLVQRLHMALLHQIEDSKLDTKDLDQSEETDEGRKVRKPESRTQICPWCGELYQRVKIHMQHCTENPEQKEGREEIRRAQMLRNKVRQHVNYMFKDKPFENSPRNRKFICNICFAAFVSEMAYDVHAEVMHSNESEDRRDLQTLLAVCNMDTARSWTAPTPEMLTQAQLAHGCHDYYMPELVARKARKRRREVANLKYGAPIVAVRAPVSTKTDHGFLAKTPPKVHPPVFPPSVNGVDNPPTVVTPADSPDSSRASSPEVVVLDSPPSPRPQPVRRVILPAGGARALGGATPVRRVRILTPGSGPPMQGRPFLMQGVNLPNGDRIRYRVVPVSQIQRAKNAIRDHELYGRSAPLRSPPPLRRMASEEQFSPESQPQSEPEPEPEPDEEPEEVEDELPSPPVEPQPRCLKVIHKSVREMFDPDNDEDEVAANEDGEVDFEVVDGDKLWTNADEVIVE